MNYGIIIHTLGWVFTFEAICMLLPLLCAVAYGEPYVMTFVITILICAVPGIPAVLKKPKNKAMYAKEGFISVALGWIAMSIAGCLPFVISGTIPGFINALFETVSGFTTTGASVLTEIEALPRSILFWRSFTHWIGGMGVLVFLVAVLPLSGGGNLYLIKAESPGPSVGKLVPKVKSTAKILYGIYTVITIAEIILLMLGGMELFEAVTISFGTAGTGGFGIRNLSAAEYSPYLQYVITVFMILFGVNFSLYYLLLIGQIKEVLRSDELKTYFIIIISATLIITANIAGSCGSLEEAFRHSAFQVGSIITTTGFSTTDFDKWPEISKTILVMLMFIGACAGSTGGGIKVSRIIILAKSVAKELRLAIHPRGIHKISMDNRLIEHETIRTSNVFIMAYVTIFAVSLLLISFDNFSFTTNFTAVAATMNNIGPGLDKVGPMANFAGFSPFAKIVLIFDMLIGRLEIFPMLVLFSPRAWKK